MQTTTRASTRRGVDMGPAEVITLVVGIALTAIGVAGLIATGFENFADYDAGEEILGFHVNGLHSVVHIALGVLGLLAWFRRPLTLAYGLLLLVGYGAAAVYGVFAVGEDWDFLALNDADNWLHLGLAAVGLLIAVLAYWEMDRRGAMLPPLDEDARYIDLTAEERAARQRREAEAYRAGPDTSGTRTR